MKVSELSDRSGVPVPTIKFYLREGLLPRGEATGANQAQYSDQHLARLCLIRALREVAGLPLASIKEVVSAVEQGPVYDVMGRTIDALAQPTPETPEIEEARQDVLALLAELGWNVRPDARAVDTLAHALASLRGSFFPGMPAEQFATYARAAEQVARHDLSRVDDWRGLPPEEALLAAVVGTVLFEPILLALRRLAHEHLSHELIEGD